MAMACTPFPPPSLVTCCWCLLMLRSTLALNLDGKNPQIFSGPQGSHFGFSLDFYKAFDQSMSIVVGAPRMNTSQPMVLEGGAVYLCPWQPEENPCRVIEFDGTGDQVFKDETLTMKIFKSHQGLGASVRVWESNIVACAPLQHWNAIEGDLESGITPVGGCYLASNNLKTFVEYSPCRDSKSEEIYNKSSYYYDKRYCEAGFSLDIAHDGKLLFGAPGGYYFTGLIALPTFSSVVSNYNPANPLQQAPGRLSRDTNHKDYYDSYRGFSVAFGEFAGDASVDYAVGIPNFKNTLGAVEIYNGNYHNKFVHQFLGEQVASYYGYAVAAADINGDGRDDVLVGAPLFMEWRSNRKLYEVGRVYLHLQTKASQFAPGPQLLTGTDLYGRFGSAIAPLGDVDMNGYQDVAVGAPFAGRDERGRVYIYGGQSTGVIAHPTQVLESPFTGRSAFGFSLKGATDIDKNGYPDLLVGAFEAGKAAIYRAQPVILAETQLFFTPDVLNPDVKNCKMLDLVGLVSCFAVHVCVRVSGKNIPERVGLNAEVQLDRLKQRFARRTFFLDSNQPSRTVPLEITRNAKADCRNFTAYLRDESEFKDKLSPIVISLNCTLVTSPSSKTLQPILHGQTFIQEQTHILLDCGEDNVCIPDLRLSAEKIKDPLLIGDDNVIPILFNATNEGEGAYEAELHVHLPLEAHFMQALWDMEVGLEKIICLPRKENLTHVVVCELGNPMKRGQKIRAGLQVSVSNLEEVERGVTFKLQIKSRNSQNPNSAIELVEIPVAAMAKVELRGSSVPAVIILPLADWELKEDSKKPEENGEKVMHIYELHNAGPGTVTDVDLMLEFPDQFQDDYFLYILQIEADAGIQCLNSMELNPLGLEIQRTTAPPTNRSKQEDRNREKREADLPESEPGETEAGKSPFLREPVRLNCSTMLCAEVICHLESLEKSQRVTVRIQSILWMQSFLKRPLEQFIIESEVSYVAHRMPYRIEPASLPSGVAMAATQVLWVSPGGEAEIPTWWIIVGVLAGLLLLAIFIFIMWKLGFFQRTRPPTEDQEDLTNDED
ncbi:integrin alpha-IIb [Rhinatrema bivittatum]|uniref:integrin alpha-IIb n=1 Tax=Rhinatrema bivittatum TaxID=194408 RepID=UPI00112C6E0E|nr:integrin alpha-IIb [Rhinatrema bivittatum]